MFSLGITTFLENHNYAFASVLGHSILIVCIALIYLTIAAIVCRLEYKINQCSRMDEYRLAGDEKSAYRKLNLSRGLIKCLKLGRKTYQVSAKGLKVESGVNIWCDGYIVYHEYLICIREFSLYHKYLFVIAKTIPEINLRIYGIVQDGHLLPPKTPKDIKTFTEFNSKACSVQDLA